LEGRENRPQLRCGIASQTHTAPSAGAGKANRDLNPVKARGEEKPIRRESVRAETHAESEYESRDPHSPDAIARAGSENFIAIVKKAPA
jgi:hypothetical protein